MYDHEDLRSSEDLQDNLGCFLRSRSIAHLLSDCDTKSHADLIQMRWLQTHVGSVYVYI